MVKEGVITVDLSGIRGTIDPKIYGHFVEHFHRCIYGGMYDEGSRLSDEQGFRKDVLQALKKIRPLILRWPGGCYADGYHWKNGVGPKNERPVTYDLAWRVEESNRFGTDEFIEYCRLIGAEPYICVNVGSGTAEEAAQWVEYCNRKGNSCYANLREKYGHPEPFKVKYWGVGNEIFGFWEIGELTADEYVKALKEYAKLMKRVDPDIKIVAVGYGYDPAWDIELIKNAGDVIDYISAHAYHYREPPDYYAAVACPAMTEKLLKLVANTIENGMYYLSTRPVPIPKEKRIDIAFDEWNAWGWAHPSPNAEISEEEFTRKFLENDRNELYTLREALFTAKYLHIFHRMCNHVTMANFSPTVNVRGMLFTHKEGVILRPPYHVFNLYANHSGETALDTKVESETFDTKITHWRRTVDLKEIPYLDASATLSKNRENLFIAAVNSHRESDIECEIKIKGGSVKSKARVWELNGDKVESYNDIDHPNDVKITKKDAIKVASEFVYVFPAHSVTVLEMSLA